MEKEKKLEAEKKAKETEKKGPKEETKKKEAQEKAEKLPKEPKKEAEKEKRPEVKTEKAKRAIARGLSLRISPKYSKYICKMIKNKTPTTAISLLKEVIQKKRPVRMPSLEVAHQRGRGIAGGKFPKKACEEIIPIVNQARANALVVGIEDPVITIAKADRASAPFRSGGRKAKRTHIFLEVRSISAIGGRKK